jgi:zinc protease
MFLINATPSRGRTPAELETAIREQIRDVQEVTITPAELERVKAQVAANSVYTRDSMFYQAMQMGTLETVGLDWHMLDHDVERIRAVTAAQVQAVAKKYLIASNLTVTVLDPQPGKTKPHATAPLGGGHVR